jgi:hypothetical protein
VTSGTLIPMSKPPTAVLIDTDILEELRADDPGKPDRELIEDMALRKLGLRTIRRLQERFDLPEEEAIRVGVEAVHQARHER